MKHGNHFKRSSHHSKTLEMQAMDNVHINAQYLIKINKKKQLFLKNY